MWPISGASEKEEVRFPRPQLPDWRTENRRLEVIRARTFFNRTSSTQGAPSRCFRPACGRGLQAGSSARGARGPWKRSWRAQWLTSGPSSLRGGLAGPRLEPPPELLPARPSWRGALELRRPSPGLAKRREFWRGEKDWRLRQPRPRLLKVAMANI